MHRAAITLLTLLSLTAAVPLRGAPLTLAQRRADPALRRLHRAADLTADRRLPDLGHDGEPLRLVDGGPEAPALAPGRLPGTQSLRLDTARLVAAPLDLSKRQFTAQAWVRLLGPGHHRGNGGATNATLLSIGIGYWDGWRLTTPFPGPGLTFELGRPRGINAFGLSDNRGPAAGLWQHVALSWDGRLMRLYLNGQLLRQAPYDGAYTTPGPDARLVVGYAGHGIGSAIMDIDEVAIHSRALEPAEIVAQMLLEQLPDAESQTDLNGLLTAAATPGGDPSPALGRLLARPLAPVVRAWLRLLAADLLPARHPLPLDLDGQPELPEFLREMLSSAVLRRLETHPGGDYPDDLLRRLLARDGLPSHARMAILRHTILARLREGQPDAAQEAFRELAALPGTDDATLLDIRLDYAHALRRHGHHRQAREAYAQAADLARRAEDTTHAPALARGVALLGAAQTLLLERRTDDALDALAQLAADATLLPHHRQEAADMASETRHRAAGLPPRDPQTHRTPITPPTIPALAVHASPNGDDRADGSPEHPVRTPQQALRLLRQRRQAAAAPQPAAIVLHGGTYQLNETLRLDPTDSGQDGAPLILMAAPGERPVLSGGLRLTGLRPETSPDLLRRLPDPTITLLSCDLPERCRTDTDTPPRAELFRDGEPLTPARYPNTGFIRTGAKPDVPSRSFDCPDERILRWTAAPDAWLTGYWRHLWAVDTHKVSAISPDTRRITLKRVGHYGLAANMPFFCFNLLEELDQPGEWFLDRLNARLYLRPLRQDDTATLELSVLTTPLLAADTLRHTVIHGLTLTMTQADAIAIGRAEHLQLSGNTISRVAGNAIVIGDASHTQLLGNDLHTLGMGGIRIRGGDRRTLTPGHLNIENNHIRNFSRIVRSYTPAILLDGVGNRIAHNLLHDAPHHAIRLEGNDHLVEYNEIHSVVYESDDQSGLDMWSDPSYRGNVIRYNFWHHIGSGRNIAGQAGIRLDDAICGVLMYANIFLRAADGNFGAIQIHGGNDNIADNNLFIDCQAAISFSSWNDATWQKYLRNNQAKYTTRVRLDQPPYSTRYPRAARLLKDHNGVNYVARSLLVRCPTLILRRRPAHVVLDTATSDAFDTRDTHDGYLRAFAPQAWDALVRDTDFRPIPFDEIGLYPDPARASVPDPTRNRAITPHYHGLDTP